MKVACIICQDSFHTNDDNLYSSSCGHIFHFPCIAKWFKEKRSCPQCQQYVTYLRRIYLNFGNNDAIIEKKSSDYLEYNEILEAHKKENEKLEKLLETERKQREEEMSAMKKRQMELEKKLRKFEQNVSKRRKKKSQETFKEIPVTRKPKTRSPCLDTNKMIHLRSGKILRNCSK